MRIRPAAITGATLLLLAAAVAFESRHFVVGFASDPLGPRAFPLLAALLLALGGLVGILGSLQNSPPVRPGAIPVPSLNDGVAGVGLDTAAVEAGAPGEALRIAAGAVSFVLFAFLLAPLGFVAATTLEFGALAVLFGGRPLKGLAVGLIFAVAVFLLFVQGLGLPLPLGVFAGGG